VELYCYCAISLHGVVLRPNEYEGQLYRCLHDARLYLLFFTSYSSPPHDSEKKSNSVTAYSIGSIFYIDLSFVYDLICSDEPLVLKQNVA
jgi:hypothetical protein